MLKFPGGKIFIFSGTFRGKESGIRGRIYVILGFGK